MSSPHLQVLLSYAAFMGFGTLLTLIQRWTKPNSRIGSAWEKGPTYLLLNIAFLAAVWMPNSWHILAFLLAIIGAGASWELSQALGLSKLERVGQQLASAGLIMGAEWLSLTVLVKIWLAVIFAFSTIMALAGQSDRLGRRIISLTGCVIYLPLCLASLLWLWHADNGGFSVAFLYLVIVTNDAFGQFIGQLFGYQPLAPRVSPAKTLEGAAGGLIFAGLLGASLSSTVGWSYFHGALMGMLIGLAGLTGDLTESSWKRALGLKDFSKLLGAQGGVLM